MICFSLTARWGCCKIVNENYLEIGPVRLVREHSTVFQVKLCLLPAGNRFFTVGGESGAYRQRKSTDT